MIVEDESPFAKTLLLYLRKRYPANKIKSEIVPSANEARVHITEAAVDPALRKHLYVVDRLIPYEKRHSQEVNPDVLPGDQVAVLIKQHLPEAPVILMSRITDDAADGTCAIEGIPLMGKANKDQLVQTIAELLELNNG